MPPLVTEILITAGLIAFIAYGVLGLLKVLQRGDYAQFYRENLDKEIRVVPPPGDDSSPDRTPNSGSSSSPNSSSSTSTSTSERLSGEDGETKE